MSVKIWIIIVNYRTADLVVDCLRSIAVQRADRPTHHAVVVDNASGDRSVEKLTEIITQEEWHQWVTVLPLDRNGGFAFGNNAGIRAALAIAHRADYLLLLNPDTVARPGAIKALVSFMDAHPEVGIAGSRLENAEGGIECSAHNLPSPLGELEAGARLGILSRLLDRYVVTPYLRDDVHECDWVSGASIAVRREVFETIGLLDEGFYLYFEEVDFCFRAKRAGWKVWYVPQSQVMHLEGAATGIRKPGARRAKYWYDSRRRLFVKLYGISGLVLADLLWACGRVTYLIRHVLRLEARRSPQDPGWLMFDLLWGDLRAIVSGETWRIRREGRIE